jgi:hypothetical protein
VSDGAPPGASPPEQRIGDIGRAFVAATRWSELGAIGLALLVAPLASVLLSLAIAAWTPFGHVWANVPFSWFAIDDVALALLLGVAWHGFGILLMPRRIRAAMEAHTWIGERELRAWQRATGSGPRGLPPTDPHAAQQWLAANPETDLNRAARAETLLLARRFDEARATIDRLPDSTPGERISRADLRATADQLEHGAAELDELRRATAEAADDDRLVGVVDLALLEVRDALARGGEWAAPLTAARAQLGTRANGALWSGYFMRRLTLSLPVLLVFAAFIGIFGAITG